MIKNEIHVRLSPHLMEALKSICIAENCNLSDIVRAALVLYVDVRECSNLLEQHKLLKSENSLEITLVKTSLKTTKVTPDLLDEFPPDDIIDW
jgi:hypothetical protein